VRNDTEFWIADTFTGSLARLTGGDQKAVETTALTCSSTPPIGMSFHKLDKAKDKNFWSVRVNSDIRLIVHRSEQSGAHPANRGRDVLMLRSPRHRPDRGGFNSCHGDAIERHSGCGPKADFVAAEAFRRLDGPPAPKPLPPSASVAKSQPAYEGSK
jgi:hypothetical protein